MNTEPTLGEAMEGKGEWRNYLITNGYWHYAKNPLQLETNTLSHAVIESADFGNFCGYQDALVGLSLVFKVEDGGLVGWSFEYMPDIQILFNKSKAKFLKDLIGTPMLILSSGGGGFGSRILACKVNESLVTERTDKGFSDKISFFTGMAKQVHALQ